MNDDSVGNIASNILDRFHQLFMQFYSKASICVSQDTILAC